MLWTILLLSFMVTLRFFFLKKATYINVSNLEFVNLCVLNILLCTYIIVSGWIRRRQYGVDGEGFREYIFINIHYQLSSAETFFHFDFIKIFVTSFSNQRSSELSSFCRRVVDFSQWNRKQRFFFNSHNMFFLFFFPETSIGYIFHRCTF